MAGKLPSFQFYPGDWQKDPNLRRCTHSAKGIWIDILCLMFECDERGVLATAGRPWTREEIAQAVGGDYNQTLSGIEELSVKGVVNLRENGAYYSRRMVRDEQRRKTNLVNGKKGGNPNLTGSVNRVSNRHHNRDDNRNPTPSSSTSSSTSSSEINTPISPQGGNDPPAAKSRKSRNGKRTADFERWYAVYPKRVGPDAAAKAFTAAMSRIESRHPDKESALEWLIRVTGDFATSPKGRGEFCWNPATFLNQGHFDDDQTQWQRGDGTDLFKGTREFLEGAK